MFRYLLLIPLALGPMLASCPGWLTPAEPPVVSVDAWGDVEIVLDRLTAEVGEQPEIQDALVQISDLDGDGKFPLLAVKFLIEPRPWATPFADPLALYVASVETDPFLTPNGVMARTMSADRLRSSLTSIFAP